MLLALLLAAQGARPPAHLVVPRSLQEERDGAPEIFSDPQLLSALGDFKPEPGAWAEYLVRSSGEQVRVRISVLPEAAPEGRYWLELDTASPGGPPAAAKLLLHGSPARAENIERLLLFMPGQAPVEIPVDQLREDMPAEPAAKAPKVSRKKRERVQVRGGTFADAEALQVGDTRLWRSDRVPLWGLIKSRSPRATVELLGSARSGAHSVFPGDQGNGSESTK
ncbi:MAG: hypothetical protein E6J78_02960 [Deltaproteobacteria bacterium]|nr:MAG: hypothetical protein E6J78_02960 [Deltaproteobacteria bacterium]